MNWLLILQGCFSGFAAGLVGWLVSSDIHAFDFANNFHNAILVSGLFAGALTGLLYSLPVFVMERNSFKTFNLFTTGFLSGLAFVMSGAVLFKITLEILERTMFLSSGFISFFWWFFAAACISGCFGFLGKSFKLFCRSLLGITPAMIIAGTLFDQYFSVSNQALQGFLIIGVSSGGSITLAWDLLKDAWLDEYPDSFFLFRYYLDDSDFFAGSSCECDLTLPDGAENAFVISENDGLHSLEVLDQNLLMKVNSSRIRYRTLVDGDLINTGQRVFIYHSRFARSRDIIAQTAG